MRRRRLGAVGTPSWWEGAGFSVSLAPSSERIGAAIRQVHVQCSLAATQGAEVRHCPVQPGQPQKALDEPSCLPKRHTKQDLQRQTSLNGGVTEFLLATAFAARRRRPNHLGIKPDRQRSALLQTIIVRRPIVGLVLRGGPTAHALSYHAGFTQ